MKIIGLAGGVGTGKSTVLSLIEETNRGFVVRADEVGHKAMIPNTESYQKIVALFGETILEEDKTINRKKVAEFVFSDSDLLEKLNAIIHPFVKNFILEEIKRVREEKLYHYFFIESAILIETGYKEICDELWVVQTEESVRRERLKASRGYSDEKITNIIENQMSEEKLLTFADKIIVNNSTIEEIRHQLENLLV